MSGKPGKDAIAGAGAGVDADADALAVLDRRLGTAAPPRANGEVVFEAPWQARVFGIAHALCDGGHFSWDDVRAALIERIGREDAARSASADPAPFEYWTCFAEALDRVVAARGICEAAALDARVAVLADRPHGHDH